MPEPEERLARAIRDHRVRLHITAQELAERVAKAGGKLSRQAISKIENGDRGISVDELFVLARALETPPLLLLFPADDLWPEAKWFTGEGPLGGDGTDTGWQAGAAPVLLRRLHDRHLADWNAAPLVAGNLGVDEDMVVILTRRLRVFTAIRLRSTRDEMRRRGLTLPVLPAAIAALDDFGGVITDDIDQEGSTEGSGADQAD